VTLLNKNGIRCGIHCSCPRSHLRVHVSLLEHESHRTTFYILLTHDADQDRTAVQTLDGLAGAILDFQRPILLRYNVLIPEECRRELEAIPNQLIERYANSVLSRRAIYANTLSPPVQGATLPETEETWQTPGDVPELPLQPSEDTDESSTADVMRQQTRYMSRHMSGDHVQDSQTSLSNNINMDMLSSQNFSGFTSPAEKSQTFSNDAQSYNAMGDFSYGIPPGPPPTLPPPTHMTTQAGPSTGSVQGVWQEHAGADGNLGYNNRPHPDFASPSNDWQISGPDMTQTMSSENTMFLAGQLTQPPSHFGATQSSIVHGVPGSRTALAPFPNQYDDNNPFAEQTFFVRYRDYIDFDRLNSDTRGTRMPRGPMH
jgi:hypothetical protein